MKDPILMTDQELADAIDPPPPPDLWAMPYIRNRSLSDISTMFVELMARIRTLEDKVRSLESADRLSPLP